MQPKCRNFDTINFVLIINTTIYSILIFLTTSTQQNPLKDWDPPKGSL